MAATRQVITGHNKDGTDMLGLRNVAAMKPHEAAIVSGSLLTVESNHFCVLKSRGAVLNVYETGQYSLVTPDKPIFGNIVQAFWGDSPWAYEVIYINRAKLLVRSTGIATSKEMAEVSYVADYYIHIDTKEDALDLVTHLPFNGTVINIDEISAYAGPAIEQAINQHVQLINLESINENITMIRDNVVDTLRTFLKIFGIHLNELKILLLPKDERMRELLSLRAFGLTPEQCVRYQLAAKMADRGLITAPNAACGQPFNIAGGMLPLGGILEQKG